MKTNDARGRSASPPVSSVVQRLGTLSWALLGIIALGFTALTLMLSLQASYAAPLILLAQNRQDDRDRVTAEQASAEAETAATAKAS